MGNFCCIMSDTADNQDVSNGLSKKRSCTDVPWLLFLLAFLAGMGYVVQVSLEKGDPYRVIYGVDSWGNTCNRKNDKIGTVELSGRDMTGLKNTFYFNFLAVAKPDLFKSTVICVKSCPAAFVLTVDDMKELSNNGTTHLCQYNVEAANFANGSSEIDTCPILPLGPYKSLLNRCVPVMALAATSSLFEATEEAALGPNTCETSGNILERVFQDFMTVKFEILLFTLAAIAIAFIVTCFMRFFAAIIIRIMVVALALGSLVGTGFLWYQWYSYKIKLDDIPAEDQTKADKDYVNYWMIGSIVGSVLAVLILLILFIMRKRIALVVQLFHESGRAVGKMPALLLQPVWTLLALTLLPGIAILFSSFVLTADEAVVNEHGMVEFETSKDIFYMRWYYLLGILWLIQLVLACQLMVIAGAVAQWFFTREKSTMGCTTPKCPIISSMLRLIRYHLGTVAFGSFIIALIQFIRIILMYIQRNLKGKSNKAVQYILKILSCCFWVLEKIVKFFTKNAYIMVAIYGCNLCTGGKRALQTILNNILRVGAIESIGTFTLFLGKLLIVGIVETVALFWYKDNTKICYMYVPLLAIGVISFFIAHCFLGIYGMALDTIFLCFCVDCDINDGGRKPYFMSKGLMKFIGRATPRFSRERLETYPPSNTIDSPVEKARRQPTVRLVSQKPVTTDIDW